MVNTRMKGMVYPLDIYLVLAPIPVHIDTKACGHIESTSRVATLSTYATRGREGHISYPLRRHLREVRYLNNALLSISVPLGEIPKDNIDCRFPDEDVVALREAWSCDPSVLSPLIVLGNNNTWAICEILSGFGIFNKLGKCHTPLTRVD